MTIKALISNSQCVSVISSQQIQLFQYLLERTNAPNEFQGYKTFDKYSHIVDDICQYDNVWTRFRVNIYWCCIVVEILFLWIIFEVSCNAPETNVNYWGYKINKLSNNNVSVYERNCNFHRGFFFLLLRHSSADVKRQISLICEYKPIKLWINEDQGE